MTESVAVVLVSPGGALLGRPASPTWDTRRWELPCRPILRGERPATAAIRCADETVAVELSRRDLVALGALDGPEQRLQVYAACRWTGLPTAATRTDFSELAWFAPSAIRRMADGDGLVADLASLALATFYPDDATPRGRLPQALV